MIVTVKWGEGVSDTIMSYILILMILVLNQNRQLPFLFKLDIHVKKGRNRVVFILPGKTVRREQTKVPGPTNLLVIPNSIQKTIQELTSLEGRHVLGEKELEQCESLSWLGFTKLPGLQGF